LLGRTGYESELTFDHDVRLTGLAPDQLYYYRIVSRDPAGNPGIDDNNGQLYTFRTLRPLDPPFFDAFETGGTNWTIHDEDGTQVTWRLGVPNNGWETEAYSPVNAWGSNLDGDNIDGADTYLISPAISLNGGNTARLRFWHSYDFTFKTEGDIVDGGEVLIFTNSVDGPAGLAAFVDEASGGWEELDIDLTPYIGRTVYLVWHYVVFALEAAPRPGWLIDDVNITVETVSPGTIIITNNLAQARFLLSGPLNRSGQGLSTIISNAPPGEYVVTFSDVPYYVAPARQTNQLASFGTVVFQGDYSFNDSNNNGMSDAWEQNYFGEVSSLRNAQTDTDYDGATDFAEFMAGTDPNRGDSTFLVAPIVVRTDQTIELTWSTTPGHVYRIYGSADAMNWVPQSEWLSADGSALTHIISLPGIGMQFYKVEVHP
jgi:hypothetical protein